MMRSFLSDLEIQCLRSLVGTSISDIFSPSLIVYEENVRLDAPASVRLDNERGFLIIGSVTIPFIADGKEFSLGDQLQFQISDRPSKIPSTPSKQLMVGPCSVVNLGSHFRVTSIDIYQCEYVASLAAETFARDVSVVQDAQITLFCGEGRPLSIAAAGDAIYVSRDLGLCHDRSFHLEPRMTLK
jgi:hypothetical protein